MTMIGRLTSPERRSVVAAKRIGYIRPMTLAMVEAWPTAMYVPMVAGWLVRDDVGVLRDSCGPIHRN